MQQTFLQTFLKNQQCLKSKFRFFIPLIHTGRNISHWNESRYYRFIDWANSKSLWNPSTLYFFKRACVIKPGWYLRSGDLRYLRYYAVDYYNLMLTVFHFNINTWCKNICMAHIKEKKNTWVNELLVLRMQSLLGIIFIYIYIYLVTKNCVCVGHKIDRHMKGYTSEKSVSHFRQKHASSPHIKLTRLECAYFREEECKNRI